MHNINGVENSDNNSKEEITLRALILKLHEWRNYLFGKWRYILIFSLLGAAIGFTYAFFQKPVYTATTTFVLEASESGNGLMSQYAGLASMAGIDLGDRGGGIFSGDNIIELYKSRKMLEKTLLTPVVINGQRQTLIQCYINFNELKDSWKDRPQLLALNFDNTNNKSIKFNQTARLRDSVLGWTVDEIRRNCLTVDKLDKKLSIIKVDVKSKDEDFSKRFNEELVKNVNQFYTQTKTKKSLDNVSILQHKVDSVKNVMNGAIYSAVAAIDATPNLNPTKQVQRNVPSQKAQFTAEANKAILSNLMQSLELGKISLLKETPLIQPVDTPVYPLKKEKFGLLKGLILGGIGLGFITCLFLVFRRLYILTIIEDGLI
ncbi:Wzz/FepE/Etk N-terminal domain-containing protein [Mucilaginibacter sp. RS28]|uniref:Wzz/FepE/Etk N-terminal domain-containing protein n=1 Tax=Mucilaginibacter straminoryzae TaxID=2932774 RepID=A0A9X1X025_9SPHI|nr:Wzz/FepE/Etk N-terminal domain-containing protein [Mucilaginibacter straminoryzae]MCJ8208568.1 Wzz/FepE/Etk N-terminal domain-containing protein [Mucilaginibacter straminoryzae]